MGSTFLSALLKQFSTSADLCRVHEMRYRCSVVITIACPANWGGKQRCQRKQRRSGAASQLKRCTLQPQAAQIFRLPSACCDSLDPADRSELLDEPSSGFPHLSRVMKPPKTYPTLDGQSCEGRQRYAEAWLSKQPRDFLWQGRHLRSLQQLPSGGSAMSVTSQNFVWTENTTIARALRAVGSAATQALFMDHKGSYRYCILAPTNPHLDRRYALLDAANRSKTISVRGGSLGRGVDHFLLHELGAQNGSSLDQMLRRMERLAIFLDAARKNNLMHNVYIQRAIDAGPAQHLRRISPSTRVLQQAQQRLSVVHSRYEHMVTNFSGWLHDLLAALPSLAVGKRDLHDDLMIRFGNEFVPDGKHKHALKPGANLRLVHPDTILFLRRQPRIRSIMKKLGYHWQWQGAG